VQAGEVLVIFRFLLPALAIAAFLALAQQTPAPPAARLDVPARGHAVIHILSANEDGEAVGEPVTPALVAFRVEAGHVDGAAILECEQNTETRRVPARESHGDQELSRVQDVVDYPVVVLTCAEGIKLAVVGLDLTVKK
jgi:hypothetical protein